jgi:hypothetical protein
VGRVLGGLGAGLAILDGTRQALAAARGDTPRGRLRAVLGSAAKFAQAAGVVMGMAGGGAAAAALIGGGLLVSTLTS